MSKLRGFAPRSPLVVLNKNTHTLQHFVGDFAPQCSPCPIDLNRSPIDLLSRGIWKASSPTQSVDDWKHQFYLCFLPPLPMHPLTFSCMKGDMGGVAPPMETLEMSPPSETRSPCRSPAGGGTSFPHFPPYPSSGRTSSGRTSSG